MQPVTKRCEELIKANIEAQLVKPQLLTAVRLGGKSPLVF